MIYNGPERFEVIHNILRNNNVLKLHTGAEIGVRAADTSEYLLHNNERLVLLLVDPYIAYLDIGYKYEDSEQSALKRAAAERLSRFNQRADWIYLPSVEASQYIEEGSLDFVFIDAEHTELSVYADVYAWYPKVRSGGILMGHDFSMDPVKKVVTAWAEKFGKKIIHSDTYSDVWAIEI